MGLETLHPKMFPSHSHTAHPPQAPGLPGRKQTVSGFELCLQGAWNLPLARFPGLGESSRGTAITQNLSGMRKPKDRGYLMHLNYSCLSLHLGQIQVKEGL